MIILFYLLISVMPMMRHPIWDRFVGELTVIKYLGGACFLYSLIYLVAGRSKTRIGFLDSAQTRWFLAFVVLGVGSSFFLGTPWELTAPSIQSLLSFVVLFVTTMIVVDSFSRLRWSILTAIASIALASLYVLREWQKYHNVYADFRPKDGAVGDPNYYTLSAVLCLPMAFYLLMAKGRPKWERLFCLGCLVVTIAGITAAASRGGFLAMVAVMMFVFINTSAQSRAKIAGIVFLLALVFASFPSSPLQRLINPQRTDERAAKIRLAVWRAGARMFLAHPLTGVGLGSFKQSANDYADPGRDSRLNNIAHNTYVELAAETGVPGIFLFLGVLYFSFRSAAKSRKLALKYKMPFLPEAALGIRAGLIGYMVAAFFISAQYQKLLWMVIFLSCAMASIVERVAHAQKRKLEIEESKKTVPEPVMDPVFVNGGNHWTLA